MNPIIYKEFGAAGKLEQKKTMELTMAVNVNEKVSQALMKF